jgi:MoaA/NifB/PqqE/SkfB family radical SAM enzyme
VDKVTISIDSGIPEEHDANRRPGAFDRAVRAVDIVMAAGLLASVSTVVTRHSLYAEGFRRIRDFADTRRIRLDVQIAMPVGKLEGRRELLMQPEDSRHIHAMRTAYPLLPNGQEFIKRDVYNSGDTPQCPAGRDFMSLTSDGHILPCIFCQYSLGRLPETTLAQARRDIMQSPWFQGTHPRCLLGEDETFYERYAAPYLGVAKPLDAYTVFHLRRS